MSNEPEIHRDQLKSIVERIERLEEEEKAIKGDKREVYAEAKGNGYDPKVLRKVVAARRRDLDERKEEEAIFDLYMQAVGEEPGAPLGSMRQVRDEGGDAVYAAAKKIVLGDRKTSTSHLQRRMQIGYNKASSLLEQMEKEGIITAPGPDGKREIISPQLRRAASDLAETLHKSGATMEVRAAPGSVFAKAGEALQEAGAPVTVTERKPLVGSFTPPKEDPFGDDD